MITTEEFTKRVREVQELTDDEVGSALAKEGWKEILPGLWAGGDNNFRDVPPRFALAFAKFEDEDGVLDLQTVADSIGDMMNQIAAEQGRLYPRRWAKWDPSTPAVERLIPPGRVLVEVQGDVFAHGLQEAIVDLLAAIAATSAAIFLVVSRDVVRVRKVLTELDLPNLLLGAIVEGQHLLLPAAEALAGLPVGGRVLVFDPREPIDLGPVVAQPLLEPDWILVRGANHPVHPGWVANLRDQASKESVPFTFDGWGSWGVVPATHAGAKVLTWSGALFPDARREVPTTAAIVARIGAKRAGNLLDGVAYDERPEIAR